MKIIELLDQAKKRPGMFIGRSNDFYSAKAFLCGLKIGAKYASIEYTWEEYLEASEELGYDPRGNIGVERDFRNKGLSEEEMVSELISIEQNAYEKALKRKGLTSDFT